MTHTGSILLAAEDPPSRTFLADNLRADGYDVLPSTAAPPRSARWRPAGRSS